MAPGPRRGPRDDGGRRARRGRRHGRSRSARWTRSPHPSTCTTAASSSRSSTRRPAPRPSPVRRGTRRAHPMRPDPPRADARPAHRRGAARRARHRRRRARRPDRARHRRLTSSAPAPAACDQRRLHPRREQPNARRPLTPSWFGRRRATATMPSRLRRAAAPPPMLPCPLVAAASFGSLAFRARFRGMRISASEARRRRPAGGPGPGRPGEKRVRRSHDHDHAPERRIDFLQQVVGKDQRGLDLHGRLALGRLRRESAAGPDVLDGSDLPRAAEPFHDLPEEGLAFGERLARRSDGRRGSAVWSERPPRGRSRRGWRLGGEGRREDERAAAASSGNERTRVMRPPSAGAYIEVACAPCRLAPTPFCSASRARVIGVRER